MGKYPSGKSGVGRKSVEKRSSGSKNVMIAVVGVRGFEGGRCFFSKKWLTVGVELG